VLYVQSLEKGGELAREAGTRPTGVDGVEAAWLHPLYGRHHQQALRLLLLHHAEPANKRESFTIFKGAMVLNRDTHQRYREIAHDPVLFSVAQGIF
jgi:hypothetical protein